ncbi:MAG: bifunctional hydroxymethylpyrimidine kinase/phosphomethylpyrimidine kinase [Sorangiineae bacterium]|nr:bifunctional hydroxymethylpyrimidine kinase/phosphomethylpyrimidine kinase [Polyangiaceae bacterium]MEB2322686.1 bifunctional hydroxymethylpyrimidine kinase/phosphomethylpyrimidine kinase [Sorangiineae bacterium]
MLVVAGSDSGGGAGIQADLKTITVLGGYAMTALTALTAQNTLGVTDVMAVDAAFVAEQMEVVLSDIGADVIKTGMLANASIVKLVAKTCERSARGVPLVVDPVMVATTGARLLERDAEAALIERLLPLASLLTPNAPEAEALTGVPVRSPDDLPRAAERLLGLGAAAVLVKGGDLTGPTVVDLLRTADGEEVRFEASRIETRSTHGTGCTLASAIATGIGEGLTLRGAVERARAYVRAAIEHAPPFGKGRGPLDHGHPLRAAGRAGPAGVD